jgi:ribonuclease BN (tRNA processing enzyme)
MSALQHHLSEFLTFELHHSLGAYSRASEELRELQKRLDEDRWLGGAQHPEFLVEVVELMHAYNHDLDVCADASTVLNRHPAPTGLPLSRGAAFNEPVSFAPDATAKQSLAWVCAFYEAGLHTLDHADGAVWPSEAMQHLENALLDPRADVAVPADDALSRLVVNRGRRLARYRGRLAEAIACGLPKAGFATSDDPVAVAGPDDIVSTIIASHLAVDHRQPLAAFVVRALVDAHLTMHEAESRLTAPLAAQLQLERAEMGGVEGTLRRSIALNTFVWAAARVAPWIFAEDAAECRYIVRFYDRAWRNNMPMRTMWISAQVSLLALHRRAYAHMLLGDKRAAYKDFHKLQHHVRETARRLERASLRVAGAAEFLDGLDALADHHIGELYRSDRDHTTALTHYKRAFDRLQRLMQERDQLVLVNSRWFVQLQLSLGKACYELGQHKACLIWYLRTWRALLELIAADTSSEVNPAALDSALAWLVRIVDEPELHKRDVVDHLRPVVDQLRAFRVDPRFTALASDVVLHLGHLLFVLYLSEYPHGTLTPIDEERELLDAHEPHVSLALKCVRRAWQLDRWRTLAVSDLLKLHFRATRDYEAAPRELVDVLARPIPVEETWPGGTNGAQSMSRTIEYILLQQLRLAPAVGDADNQIARDLMHSLLSHTDSIEARKSHVHEYLTRRPTCTQLPDRDARSAIEFVCLRRYSSAYPILPRPQAFRSHGGGYFVRIHPRRGGGRAYGIAIDPGTSYVECLYRAGFALSDLDMVVVTHDHVDHASSLEPLLALRHEMRMLRANLKPLIVLGNRSVVDRWMPIATYERDASLSFVCLDAPETELRRLDDLVSERVNALNAAPVGRKRTQVHITPLSSELGGGAGHRDLADNPSYGVLLTVGEGDRERTIAITSDLPGIPPALQGTPAWRQALNADVLVCHLSTVPLAELRQMAGLRTPDDETIASDIEWINQTWARDEAMRARLTYAYWLDGARNAVNEVTHVAPVGDDARLTDWQVPSGHPYLGGMLRIAREYADQEKSGSAQRLFVIGELSEELGSFRGRIAWQLNRHLFEGTCCSAVTSDIGLQVVLTVPPRKAPPGGLVGAVSVLCSSCDLDNDLAPLERYHSPDSIFEVCVKGENEGIFYNCREHDPARRSRDPIFLEKLERYDVFGR